MKIFNENYVSEVLQGIFREAFPNSPKQVKVNLLTYGIKTKKTGEKSALFLCIHNEYGLVGFAVFFGSKKILRFYNHEGENVWLETERQFKPIKKGTVMKKVES